MSYRYEFTFLRESGDEIAAAPVEPDWRPVLESLHFEGARRGDFPALLVSGNSLRRWSVTPVWRADTGRPYVRGFRVVVRPNEGTSQSPDASMAAEVPVLYLRSAAQRASAELVERGLLVAGEPFRYLVGAYPLAATNELVRAEGIEFALDEVIEPIAADDVPLSTFDNRATERERSLDFPLFLPQRVIAETIDLGREAGDVETGGFLIGYLHWDSRIPEIYVQITAQIPALHTEASATKVTFTPATWIAAEAALRSRGRGEQLLGWWHVHQDLCRLRGCAPEKRIDCTVSKPFFSEDDVLLHTTCFSRPYHVGLLVSDHSRDGWSATLYGWRNGMVVERGFQRSDPSDVSDRSDQSDLSDQENCDATHTTH